MEQNQCKKHESDPLETTIEISLVLFDFLDFKGIFYFLDFKSSFILEWRFDTRPREAGAFTWSKMSRKVTLSLNMLESSSQPKSTSKLQEYYTTAS